MTTDRDFDRLARAWLELGPDEAPDRVIAAVLQASEVTPQVRRRFRWPTWRPFQMNRLLLLAGTAVLLVVLIGGGAFFVGSRTPSLPTASPTPSLPGVVSPSAGARFAGTVAIGDPIAPRWLVTDGHTLWAHQLQALVGIDLATSALTGTIPIRGGSDYGYATFADGAIWQTDFDRDVVLRIDPASGAVVATITVGQAPEGVAATPGAIWVADLHGGTITRIDPVTNKVVATIPVGPVDTGGPNTMTAGPNGVYVQVGNIASVVHIDPATNKVGFTVPLDGPVASDGVDVWVGANGGPNGPRVVRIDPASGKILTDVSIDSPSDGIGSVAVGLGSVWVTAGPWLYRIDPNTGSVVGRIACDGGDVIVAGDSVWVSAEGQPYVQRFVPL
jgi:YVTN family beta-propeller protein